jgi:hypothetical protein
MHCVSLFFIGLFSMHRRYYSAAKPGFFMPSPYQLLYTQPDRHTTTYALVRVFTNQQAAVLIFRFVRTRTGAEANTQSYH